MEYKVNDYKEAKDWLKNTDAILITASNPDPRCVHADDGGRS